MKIQPGGEGVETFMNGMKLSSFFVLRSVPSFFHGRRLRGFFLFFFVLGAGCFVSSLMVLAFFPHVDDDDISGSVCVLRGSWNAFS